MSALKPILNFLSVLLKGLGVAAAFVFVHKSGRTTEANKNLTKNNEVKNAQLKISARPVHSIGDILKRMHNNER